MTTNALLIILIAGETAGATASRRPTGVAPLAAVTRTFDVITDFNFTLQPGQSFQLDFQWDDAYLEGGSSSPNYQVNTESTDAFDQETRAINEIAVRFAESLVTNLLEGF